MIRVTINECHSLFASAWRQKRVPFEEVTLFSTEVTKEQSNLFYAVMNLPQKYRNVVYLYYYEDYSVKEMAEILKIKESTLQTRLMRARGRLKKQLEGEWQDDESKNISEYIFKSPFIGS